MWELFDITRELDMIIEKRRLEKHNMQTSHHIHGIVHHNFAVEHTAMLLTMLHSLPKKQWLHSSLHITSPLLTRSRCWPQQRPRIEFPHALVSITMRVFYMIAVGLYVVGVDIAAAAAAAAVG